MSGLAHMLGLGGGAFALLYLFVRLCAWIVEDSR